MVTKYYNIHNLVRLRIENHKDIFNRLSYFEVDNVENIDVDIILGNFDPPISPEYELVNGKYWVGNHSLYCVYRHKLSFWKIWIEGFNQDKTRIHFWGDPWFSYELLLMLIIEPLLVYKLAKKGVLILHASSLSVDGKGYLFTGGTGIGKTTIMLKLMNNLNTEYFSDDQSYVCGRTLYSYPLPVGFRKHQVDQCEISLSVYDYCVLVLHNLINTMTRYYPNLTLRVEPKNIRFKNSPYRFPVGWRVPIDTIFVLSKTIGAPGIQKLSSEQAYKKILKYNEGNEDKLEIFHKYFSAYSSVYPDIDYWTPFEKKLFDLLNSGVNVYEVLLSRKYNFDIVLNEILNIMRGTSEV